MEIRFVEKKTEEKAEKEAEVWFEQWKNDKNADIESYFKSIWLDGYKTGIGKSLMPKESEVKG